MYKIRHIIIPIDRIHRLPLTPQRTHSICTVPDLCRSFIITRFTYETDTLWLDLGTTWLSLGKDESLG